MSYFTNPLFNNSSYLPNGVALPPGSQLSMEAQIALHNQMMATGGGPGAGTGLSSNSSAQQQRLLMAQAQAQEQARVQHAQALQAVQREDDMLMQILLQRNQERRELALQGVPAGSLGSSLGHVSGASGLSPAQAAALQGGAGAGMLPPFYGANAAARLQADQDLQQQILLEEARSRQGLGSMRSLGFIHPHTGLAMPGAGAPGGESGLMAALQGLHSHQERDILTHSLSNRASAGQNARASLDTSLKEDDEEEEEEELVADDEDEDMERGSMSKKRKANDEDSRRAPSGFKLFLAEEKERLLKDFDEKSANDDESGGEHADKKERAEKKRSRKSTMNKDDISATIEARWEALSEEKRQHFHALAAKDRSKKSRSESIDSSERSHDAEDKDSFAAGQKGSRVPKEQSAPRKPSSAFLLFSNGRRKQIKQSHPEANNAELSKILSALWRDAPDDVRDYYKEKSQELTNEYKVEMAAWRKKVAGEKKALRDATSSGQAASMAFGAGVGGLGIPGAAFSSGVPPGQLSGLYAGVDPRLMYGAPMDPLQAALMGQIPPVVPPLSMMRQPTAVPSSRNASAVEDPSAHESDEEEVEIKYDNSDPNAPPKRPMSAFLAFSNKRRKSLKKQYPYATNADLSKMLSKTWRECPDVIREKYLKEATSLSKQYREALGKWKKNQEQTKSAAKVQQDDSGDGEDDSGWSAAPQSNVMTIGNQILLLFKKNDWDAVTVASRVVDLCRIYDWAEVEAATRDCLQQCRKKGRDDLEQVSQRAEALEMIRLKIPASDVEAMRMELASDFLDALEAWHKCEKSCEGSKSFSNLENIESIFRIFVESASRDLYERVEAWAAKCTPDQLKSIESMHDLFDRLDACEVPVECLDAKAKKKCANVIVEREKILAIESLNIKREELIENTKGSEPKFTWCMPKAATESPALNEFLHSDEKGPKIVVISEGDESSRKNWLRKWQFSDIDKNGQPIRTKEVLKAGFTINITVKDRKTHSTTIEVTKLKDYHAAMVNSYLEDMEELRRVSVQLKDRDFGGALASNPVAVADSAPVEPKDEKLQDASNLKDATMENECEERAKEKSASPTEDNAEVESGSESATELKKVEAVEGKSNDDESAQEVSAKSSKEEKEDDDERMEEEAEQEDDATETAKEDELSLKEGGKEGAKGDDDEMEEEAEQEEDATETAKEDELNPKEGAEEAAKEDANVDQEESVEKEKPDVVMEDAKKEDSKDDAVDDQDKETETPTEADKRDVEVREDAKAAAEVEEEKEPQDPEEEEEEEETTMETKTVEDTDGPEANEGKKDDKEESEDEGEDDQEVEPQERRSSRKSTTLPAEKSPSATETEGRRTRRSFSRK